MSVSSPRFQSKLVPGLVMWTNGAIVRVAVDEETGRIKRSGITLKVDVLESFARTSIDDDALAREVFETVERHVLERGSR